MDPGPRTQVNLIYLSVYDTCGGTQVPKDIEQATKYTHIFLELKGIDGKTFTSRRNLQVADDITVYEYPKLTQ